MSSNRVIKQHIFGERFATRGLYKVLALTVVADARPVGPEGQLSTRYGTRRQRHLRRHHNQPLQNTFASAAGRRCFRLQPRHASKLRKPARKVLHEAEHCHTPHDATPNEPSRIIKSDPSVAFPADGHHCLMPSLNKLHVTELHNEIFSSTSRSKPNTCTLIQHPAKDAGVHTCASRRKPAGPGDSEAFRVRAARPDDLGGAPPPLTRLSRLRSEQSGDVAFAGQPRPIAVQLNDVCCGTD